LFGVGLDNGHCDALLPVEEKQEVDFFFLQSLLFYKQTMSTQEQHIVILSSLVS
jgi:hypothetical protein